MSISVAREGMEGEPDWMIESTLRRKREELARRWEEREARLDRIREKERSMEKRGPKRRRIEEPALRTKGAAKDQDEEAEFLLDDWNQNGEVENNDGASLFSSETRALMEKVGLSVRKKDHEEEDNDDELKVVYIFLQPPLAMALPRSEAHGLSRYTTLRERIPSSRSSYPNSVGPRFLLPCRLPRPNHRRKKSHL